MEGRCIIQYTKEQVCCFSGHRPEKLGFPNGEAFFSGPLESAVRRAAQAGCSAFYTGMSRGFDLWAARAVLSLREELGLSLWCAVPYAGQEERWEERWRSDYREVLFAANRVFCLHDHYVSGCYHERNRFMVDGSCRLICYFNGQPGGTAFTVRLARKRGLYVDNLADHQLSLWGGSGERGV